jgi:uncharacterized membrane protein YqjE
MSTERLRQSTLTRAISDVVADFADLVQKEMKLARAEIAEKLSNKLRAGVWLGGAAALAFLAVALLVQALVLWIATMGLSLAMACLIVAGALAAVAALAYAAGRADASESLAPDRTIHQFNRDIEETKERLT